MVSTRFVLAIVAALFVLAISVDAAYRKPPFNGSIFGKRSSTITDYEITSRAMSSVCESVTETCNAWLARQDSN
ncbi:neuropeptide SIFamide [Osmia lignaria lignaria]|uniref:SIFamide-related peptide n=1 Tax=Osmia bicornis bicornis TaxID=1437191 RepID=UPI0010F5118A|nr:SIFamide-related peptide [Osmia bicornis bicornis]XP_029049213.1 SIFamide-related peptide [Osmia bicornis bicornis]XP_029049214.1 SIFamide-related peptide [Osmia bicornis bicornis]XP_034178091.1 SIFamide-related peptide [Osmia lignaria]XP_034178092.1 SIFamide-related peptide [Osmia lignaria]